MSLGVPENPIDIVFFSVFSDAHNPNQIRKWLNGLVTPFFLCAVLGFGGCISLLGCLSGNQPKTLTFFFDTLLHR